MEPHEFLVGARYRSRKGSYEVLAIEEGNLFIRYDSGEEAHVDAKTLARIATNIEREEKRIFPSGLPEGREADFAWTLGVFTGHGSLQAEVPPQSQEGFLHSYAQLCGGPPSEGYFPISFGGENKWGSELRIYYPETAPANPRFVLPHGVNDKEAPHPGLRRVNNNALWWHLIEQLGFCCGSHQQILAIAARIPEQFRNDFLDGAS